MPTLNNPRHEAFAQAIVAGLANGGSNTQAYLAAGYQAKNGNSAESAASSRLRLFKGITLRVAELQEQIRRKKKVTLEQISSRLDIASTIAEEDRLPTAIVAAETAKAKLYGLEIDRIELGRAGDFSKVSTSQDLALRMLLRASQGRIQDITAIDDNAADAALRELSRHARAMGEIVDSLCARRALPVLRESTSA